MHTLEYIHRFKNGFLYKKWAKRCIQELMQNFTNGRGELLIDIGDFEDKRYSVARDVMELRTRRALKNCLDLDKVNLRPPLDKCLSDVFAEGKRKARIALLLGEDWKFRRCAVTFAQQVAEMLPQDHRLEKMMARP